MKHQSSHNTVNHSGGICSTLSFLMVPQMLLCVRDGLGGISLSQLHKSLGQIPGGSNHNLPVHPCRRNRHPEKQVHLTLTPVFGQGALPAGGDQLSTARQEPQKQGVSLGDNWCWPVGSYSSLVLEGGHQ